MHCFFSKTESIQQHQRRATTRAEGSIVEPVRGGAGSIFLHISPATAAPALAPFSIGHLRDHFFCLLTVSLPQKSGAFAGGGGLQLAADSSQPLPRARRGSLWSRRARARRQRPGAAAASLDAGDRRWIRSPGVGGRRLPEIDARASLLLHPARCRAVFQLPGASVPTLRVALGSPPQRARAAAARRRARRDNWQLFLCARRLCAHFPSPPPNAHTTLVTMAEGKQHLSIVICGHVDSGKVRVLLRRGGQSFRAPAIWRPALCSARSSLAFARTHQSLSALPRRNKIERPKPPLEKRAAACLRAAYWDTAADLACPQPHPSPPNTNKNNLKQPNR